jgi:hypothetical protein
MIVKKLVFKIRSEIPNETWFDEIQAAVYEKLQVCHGFIMFTGLFSPQNIVVCLKFVTGN